MDSIVVLTLQRFWPAVKGLK